MALFLIGALRAIVEMLGLCLLAQGILYLLAGEGRAGNPIYRFFSLLTRGPRRIVAKSLPGRSATTVGSVCLVILFASWIGLALMRKFI